MGDSRTSSHNPGECVVCLKSYDEKQRRPRSLPCGHPFCSFCVTNLIKNGKLKCPSCRTTHKATLATQFPINYGMEEIIKSLKQVHVSQPLTTESAPLEARGVKNIQFVLTEQENNLLKIDALCQETEHQLEMYEAQLLEWQREHETLIAKLSLMASSHHNAIKLLKREYDCVSNARAKGNEQRKEREAVKQHLATAASTHAAVDVIEVADACSNAASYWYNKCQSWFPNVQVVHTSRKERRMTKKVLAMVNKVTEGAVPDPVYLGNASSTIMKKVNWITKILSTDELKPRSGVMTTLLDAGRVMGVQEHQGRARSSKMSLQGDQLHLHVLREHPTPDDTYTFQHSCLMKLLDSSRARVFLDLNWGGTTGGRVYIDMTLDTGLAKQFLMLCTGEQGPSYAGTRLLEVVNRGWPGAYVCGGDYERNTGDGGAPLLPDLHENQDYEMLAKSGTVGTLFPPGSAQCAQFYVCIRDEDSSYGFGFGEVSSGLEVFKAAAKCQKITDVKVVSCGVVLPV
ncbi:uncharacterized protein [Procambarus clarkii]|uniref:uncharacterized protein isoform X2 n=1 Tax=Procambarus clarkii TaxID=6728 RepID=UPI0037433B2F